MPIGLAGVVGTLGAVLSLIGDGTRESFGGSYVVDKFALLFKVFFLVTASLVLALSLRYFREGGFYQGEYYFLLLTSFLGCVMMPSSRDMLMLFIALELVSAPGFLMAAFRKGDVKSNEAGAEVLPHRRAVDRRDAVRHEPDLRRDGRRDAARCDRHGARRPRPERWRRSSSPRSCSWSSASRSRCRRSRSSSGRPTPTRASPVPVAAFLAVASKPWPASPDCCSSCSSPSSASTSSGCRSSRSCRSRTMTIGNLVALQQTQMVRLLAYSGIAQAGYILLPFALVTDDAGLERARRSRRRSPTS